MTKTAGTTRQKTALTVALDTTKHEYLTLDNEQGNINRHIRNTKYHTKQTAKMRG